MYKNLSLLYDEYMEDIDYKAWADYLADLAQEALGRKVDTALDFGCGTGSITVELAKKMTIAGVDISEDMLTLADQKAREENELISFFHADMRDFNLPERVDLIICTCDSVNYLKQDELEPFFKHVYESLSDKGVFLFDIVSEKYLKDFVAVQSFVYETDDIYFIWESEVHNEYIEYFLTYFIKQKDDLYQRVDETQREYFLSLKFIRRCLKKAGFKDIQTFEFTGKSKPNADSSRIQFRAVRN